MIIAIVLFSVAIVLEIACLVGLFMAHKRLSRYFWMVLGLKAFLPGFSRRVARAVRSGSQATAYIRQTVAAWERALPWWIKVMLVTFKRVRKIRLKSS